MSKNRRRQYLMEMVLLAPLVLVGLSAPALAVTDAEKAHCASLLKPANGSENLKPSDLAPNPQLWLKIKQSLQKNVTHLEHPLESAGQNADRIGEVYRRMGAEFPELREVLGVVARAEAGNPPTLAEYAALKRRIGKRLIGVSRNPRSDLEAFAALETDRAMARLENEVDFPKPKEEPRVPKEEIPKDKEKPKPKKESPEEEGEEEPKWNKTQDQYKPENKDLSQSGKKQKNVDIVLTDAEVPKRLLRQKIYDQFDLKGWSTAPALREPILRERQATKKLVLNPLGETVVDVPVPYGYTLAPGRYADHEVIEVGPGEFRARVSGKSPVTLSLFRVTKEGHLSSLAKKNTSNTLSHWPKPLLLFTESLKGLSPHEAALRLEKYLSEEGGFLYYSKGDQISEGELSRIDERMNELLSQGMPKPMAMAHAGAFNCDGAAWIGALLLRDVLGHDVRVIGGRTSAGVKTLAEGKFHVVKSADPAHAWVEVHDGNSWAPFDMTPKNNTPDGRSAPTDVERESTPENKKSKSDPKEKGQKSDQKGEGDPSKNEDAKDSEKDKKTDENKNPKKEESKDPDKKEKHESEGEGADVPGSKKIDDLLNAKSTQRKKNEVRDQSLVDRLLKRNELMLLEHLLHEGHLTGFGAKTETVLDVLAENPSWRNAVERSRGKTSLLIQDAKFSKFSGLRDYVNEIKGDFGKNELRQAVQKTKLAQRMLLALADYRSLARSEIESLQAIESILRGLSVIKHKNAKEFEAVQTLLADLPGNVSKSWLARQYGKDYAELGTAANLQLASDLVDGKLKPLEQMAAARKFVDMTLDSTPEPRWKDESTFNKSLVSKPQQDLVVTRNPLDFAKMLWSLQPGEPIFAPTIQGRQFAIGSLETWRVPNPVLPIERKVSVVYYDVSGSMGGGPIESQDALLMAFVDKALSEVDAIGRPTHEIYLIPFNDNLLQGVNIASREDAANFLARRMNLRTQTNGGTDIQKAIENFYEIVATSHRNKSAQGREKLFRKANMVLFTDGGSNIDMAALEAKRKTIPKDVDVRMNFVSIGDQVNETLATLSKNEKLASGKPTFRKMDSEMIRSLNDISVEYDPDAFATHERISGQLLSEIDAWLSKITVDPRLAGNQAHVDQAMLQLKLTTTDVAKLSGLREALSLAQLEPILGSLKLEVPVKLRLLEAITESYPQLTGRSWREMTLPEKESLSKLRAWALR